MTGKFVPTNQKPETFKGWFRRYLARQTPLRDEDGWPRMGFVNQTDVEMAARAAWNAARRTITRK